MGVLAAVHKKADAGAVGALRLRKPHAPHGFGPPTNRGVPYLIMGTLEHKNHNKRSTPQ